MNNIILIDMTSIVSPMPTFSDLPIDIITYILSLCECDITKESHILDFNKMGRLKKKKIHSSHAATHICPSPISFIGELSKELFKKSPTCLGPVLLTRLGTVNKDFRLASAPLWQSIYIHHIKNDKPYKRKYTHEQYKKKYLLYILKQEQNKLDFWVKQHKYAEIMTMIKNNNAARYLEIIKKAVEEDKLNESDIHEISNLLQYSHLAVETNYVREVLLRLKCIDNVIYYRRRAIEEYNYFKKKEVKYKASIAKSKKAINSLC